ncbi:MAG: CZB domain-containing protein [Sulfurimonas sp.]|nr:CZB domain-containing protein [Sulfurimonas sp.]
MNKKEMLEALLNAKNTHKVQMNTVNLSIKGKILPDNMILDKEICSFGKWLYDDKSNLKELVGSLFFKKLDEEYIRWLNECGKIFKILSKNEKTTLLSSIFKKKEVMKFEKATIYYEQLKNTSNNLQRVLMSCERRMSALPESKFS